MSAIARKHEQGLTHLVTIVYVSFEGLQFEHGTYDLIWSQDSFLHSGARDKAIAEAARVLAPGGHIIFTDPMAVDSADAEQLGPILQRLHLSTLGSPGFYKQAFAQHGLNQFTLDNQTGQLVAHYSRVLQELEAAESKLTHRVSQEYCQRRKGGLRHWIEGGSNGQLCWGICLTSR